MRITEKDIQKVLNRLAETLDLAISNQDAVKRGKTHYLYIEYAACYGGYRIVSVALDSGAHYDALGESSSCSRRKASEMLDVLLAFERGLEYLANKSNPNI